MSSMYQKEMLHGTVYLIHGPPCSSRPSWQILFLSKKKNNPREISSLLAQALYTAFVLHFPFPAGLVSLRRGAGSSLQSMPRRRAAPSCWCRSSGPKRHPFGPSGRPKTASPTRDGNGEFTTLTQRLRFQKNSGDVLKSGLDR